MPVNRSPHEDLSDREFQVLNLLGAGKRVSQIAEELCLSYNTISTYRSRIFSKLGLKNDAQLVRYALQHGLSD
jgi:two-component system, NarL family, invasion response regulator UvrY